MTLLYVLYIIISEDKIHILFTKGGKNMANVKVRLKDASNNVLHPETDWSVVRNKPSIEMSNTGEEWNIADSITISASNGLYLTGGSGEHVYVEDCRPFTVRHIMNIGGCEFEIFDDQDKALTMSDVKLILGSHSLPAFGYDSTNKRIFYSVRFNLNGLYADYVKVTNGTLDSNTINLGDNVTEIARYVLH